MSKLRAREIQESIRQVLLHDWNPIGVANEPRAQDEYDSYVGAVYRLIASGSSEQEIADHLWKIETARMGLSSPEASALLPVARKLKALGVRLEGRGPAALQAHAAGGRALHFDITWHAGILGHIPIIALQPGGHLEEMLCW